MRALSARLCIHARLSAGNDGDHYVHNDAIRLSDQRGHVRQANAPRHALNGIAEEHERNPYEPREPVPADRVRAHQFVKSGTTFGGTSKPA